MFTVKIPKPVISTTVPKIHLDALRVTCLWSRKLWMISGPFTRDPCGSLVTQNPVQPPFGPVAPTLGRFHRVWAKTADATAL